MEKSNPLYELFCTISDYCDKIEEANYNLYKLFSPVSIADIENWESSHNAKLPEGYKNWIMLSNGFEMGSSANIFPLERIFKFPFPECLELDSSEDYYDIGDFIGDGSELLSDKNGNFYELDHYSGLEKTTFEKFLENWVIKCLENDLREINDL